MKSLTVVFITGKQEKRDEWAIKGGWMLLFGSGKFVTRGTVEVIKEIKTKLFLGMICLCE